MGNSNPQVKFSYGKMDQNKSACVEISSSMGEKHRLDFTEMTAFTGFRTVPSILITNDPYRQIHHNRFCNGLLHNGSHNGSAKILVVRRIYNTLIGKNC